MKKMTVIAFSVLLAALFAFVNSMWAADPLTGTWRFDPLQTSDTNPNQTTFTSKGNGITILTNANKPYDAMYDGKDYPTGSGGTINVVRVNERALASTSKRDGKVISKTTRTVSADGKQMTIVTEGTGLEGPYKNTFIYDRIGSAPAGDAFLGTWRQDYSKSKYEPPLTRIIRVDGDTLDYASSTSGHIVTAKFDGKDYKLETSNSTYRLKRINDSTIEISVTSQVGPPVTMQWQAKGNMLIDTQIGTAPTGKPYKYVGIYERVK